MPTIFSQQVQQAPQAPQAPPSAPVTPAAPVVVGATTGNGTLAIPASAAEVDALRSRREELSTQLNSATSRRSELARRLPGMDPAVRGGIEQRIALLDKRILSLESQIDQTGQQLAAVSPAVLAATATATPFIERIDPDTFTAIGVLFTMFVLGPLAIAWSRLLWKRASAPPRPPILSTEAGQRLERIETAVDAIAIEIERVSEGQRFMTRLFTEERDAPALGAGERPAEPVRVGSEAAARVPRGS